MALNPGSPRATVVSPYLATIGIGPGGIFEILSTVLTIYQLDQQFDLWEQDIDNLQDLAECYEEIGTRYKNARLGLRGRDAEVFGFQNSLPSYPGPCLDRVTQARLNGLIQVEQQQADALKATPAWACGDACNINYESAKAEIQLGLHAMSTAENYEQNIEDQYQQMRITAIGRSTGGAIPNVSGAFRAVSAIAQDSLSRSTAGLNSAIGSFGNVVGNISNRYFSDNTRVVNQQTTVNNPVRIADSPDGVATPLVPERVLRAEPVVRESQITGLTDPIN